MTEKDFWRFLEKAWEKGMAAQVCGSMDSPDPEIQAAGAYIGGHALLPADYQDISEEVIQSIGMLLLRPGVGFRTKEAIMVLLAHQASKTALNVLKEYNRAPDEDLRYFAKFALDECKCWN